MGTLFFSRVAAPPESPLWTNSTPDGERRLPPQRIAAGSTLPLKSYCGLSVPQAFMGWSSPAACDDARNSLRWRSLGKRPTSLPARNLAAARQRSGAVAPRVGRGYRQAWISLILRNVDSADTAENMGRRRPACQCRSLPPRLRLHHSPPPSTPRLTSRRYTTSMWARPRWHQGWCGASGRIADRNHARRRATGLALPDRTPTLRPPPPRRRCGSPQ